MNSFIVSDYGVIPNCDKLQTASIQAVLDLCKNNGGKIIFPAGKYLFSSLYVYSNTEIYLCTDAKLFGSDEISDYEEINFPSSVTQYHDFAVLAPQIKEYGFTAEKYCTAMFTSINETNVSYTFEEGSLIDGQHCFNEKGDQGYRGPHTIWMTACKNLTFNGVTIQKSGNFAFQLDGCQEIYLNNVTVRRGDDGIHLNGCQNIRIENSSFETGDDCIAGLNIVNLLVKNCYVNSACDCFRLGGKNIHILDSKMIGPAKYPHRVSTAKGKNFDLPDEEGRRNTFVCFCYFTTDVYPMDSENIVIENCEIRGIDRFLYDSQNFNVFQSGGKIKDLTIKNVTFDGLKEPSIYDEKTTFHCENVRADEQSSTLFLPKK